MPSWAHTDDTTDIASIGILLLGTMRNRVLRRRPDIAKAFTACTPPACRHHKGSSNASKTGNSFIQHVKKSMLLCRPLTFHPLPPRPFTSTAKSKRCNRKLASHYSWAADWRLDQQHPASAAVMKLSPSTVVLMRRPIQQLAHRTTICQPPARATKMRCVSAAAMTQPTNHNQTYVQLHCHHETIVD